MSLFTELKRRNVIRIAGLYLVGAWLVTQVAGTVLPMFGAPEWIARSVVILLAIGFVPALVVSWVFEMTPDGLKRDVDVPASESVAPRTARRLDRGIIVVLMLALGYFAVDKFLLSRPAGAQANAVPVVKPSATPAAPEKSIAVMAFSDLSPGGDQGYFSDGMSEAVLSALSQVRDLRVAGRSSSFYFKGRNTGAREIGRALGVAHILEGSVRKQEQRVRISAQLVRASDGFQLWSKTFDGELTDVFELQDQIARAITGQLQVVLEGGTQARLVAVATTNPDAYELYLKATSIFDRRDGPRFPEAIAALKQAIALDPKFARAWSRLAVVQTAGTSFINDLDLDVTHWDVLAAAEAALALDPTLAEPWAAIGNSYSKRRGGLVLSREAFERALAVNPDDVMANFWAGLSLCMTGYSDEGRTRIEHALKIDPRMPNLVRWRGVLYLHAGEHERARQFLERAKSDGLLIAGRELADLAYARGDVEAALRLWPDGVRVLLEALPPDGIEVLGAGMYGNDPVARARALDMLETYLSSHQGQVQGTLPLVLAKLGSPARAIQVWLEHGVTDPSDLSVQLWSPTGKVLRQQPEWRELRRALGLIDLWDKYGAPDLCRKVADGDYQCD